jgi:hypothetical protein
MKKRKWAAQQKLQIVLEGMNGNFAPIIRSARRSITNGERLIKDSSKLFERGGSDHEAERLEQCDTYDQLLSAL